MSQPHHPSPGAAPPQPPSPQAVEERLAHLFRASRQRGLIHPLEHLVHQLRSEGAAASPEAHDERAG